MDTNYKIIVKEFPDGMYIRKDCMRRWLFDKFFTKNQKEIAIDLICKKQTEMLIDDGHSYDSDEYKELEAIKIKIKNMLDIFKGE